LSLDTFFEFRGDVEIPPKGSDEPIVIDGRGVFEEKSLKDKKTILSRFEGVIRDNARKGYATKTVYQESGFPNLKWSYEG